MARRKSSIAKRFAKMRGLPPDEKSLMQRIGNLMDSAINNRQSTNPFENARKITTRDIYPPTGILVKQGIKSVKIIWDPTPSNALLRYQVTFDNLTTGERTVKSTFTNEVIFKATKGTYIARIVSISRNRSTSLVKTVQFNAGDEVMQLEGGKNGALELGTLVQDDILHVEGYSIYVWGSVVLDKYVLANEVNPTITFRLWRADGPDGEFARASLVETIELYAATESASNLDGSARGGLITRPDAIAGRAGSFETSQSIMFSPISVAEVENDEIFTYFLQAINRTTDADEVNLSLTLWTGADGQSDAVPGDPFTPEPDYVFPHKNSFHTQVVGYDNSANPALDTRSMWAYIPQELNLIGNQHTIALWFRPDDLNAANMAATRNASNPDGGALELLSRIAIRRPSGTNYQSNSWEIKAVGVQLGGAGGQAHQIQIRYNPEDGTDGTQRNVEYGALSPTTGSNKDISADLFSWGGAGTAGPTENDGWYFLVVCFEGGDFTLADPSKIRVYMNSAAHPITGAPVMIKLVPNATDTFESPIEQDDTDTMGYNLSASATDGGGNLVHNVSDGLFMGGKRTPNTNSQFQAHQLGIWNIALDRLATGTIEDVGLVDGIVKTSAIDYLFNKGFGTTVDWKQPSPLKTNLSIIGGSNPGKSRDYSHNENLVHLIQFGAVEQAMSTGFPGRDTGYHYFKGDLNFTGITPVGRFRASFDYADPGPATETNDGNHYTDNTTIADILSPEGTNGTTQFDEAYPGQNL